MSRWFVIGFIFALVIPAAVQAQGKKPPNIIYIMSDDHASAAMDVSDGLAGDLAKLCAASGVSAIVNAPTIPFSGTLAMLIDQYYGILEFAVSGGDDYEILCTIPENRFDAFAQAASVAGIPVTSIGTIIAGIAFPRFIDGQGAEIALPRRSYSHF